MFQLLIKIIYIAIFTFLASCNQRSKTPLIAKDETSEKERNNRLIVFVGEKVRMKELTDQGDFDFGFYATYKVLERVYGNYEPDFISFTIYSHYGIPDFVDDKHVLLFVSEDNGKYYHEKYQYFPVYRTKNGRWAGVYYQHEYNPNSSVKPEKIDFVEEVSFSLTTKLSDGRELIEQLSAVLEHDFSRYFSTSAGIARLQAKDTNHDAVRSKALQKKADDLEGLVARLQESLRDKNKIIALLEEKQC